MRLPEWDREKQMWDRYRAAHIGVRKHELVATTTWQYPPFIMFDTGEVAGMRFTYNPADRGLYELLNVSVYLTSDDQCPTLYTTDGTPVKKAWYDNSGHQYLLIDHDVGKAVSLVGIDAARIPTRFTHGGAPTIEVYWPGEGRDPVGGPVTINRPDKIALTAEERERKDEFVAVTTAALKLTDHPATRPVAGQYFDHSIALPVERLLAVSSWQELDENELRGFFFHGVSRSRIDVPFLLTEKPA